MWYEQKGGSKFFSNDDAPKTMLEIWTRKHNNGRSITPMHAAGTRLLGEIISLHKARRLKSSYQSTILSPEYLKKEFDDNGVKDIIQSEFWLKKVYLIVQMFFPLLKLLRSVDSNIPSMAIIFKDTPAPQPLIRW